MFVSFSAEFYFCVLQTEHDIKSFTPRDDIKKVKPIHVLQNSYIEWFEWFIFVIQFAIGL